MSAEERVEELPPWTFPARLRGMLSRPRVLLFLTLFGVYAYFYQAGGWNQNSRFDLTRALVEQGSFVIDRYAHNTGDDSVKDGHHYCDKAPGASFLCVPVYAVFHRLAARPNPMPPDLLAVGVWLCIVLAVSLPSALGATYLERLAFALGVPPPASFVLALAYGLGTMALPYSTLLYGNQLSGSLLVIAFALLVEVRFGKAATWARAFGAGACLGYAVVTEYPAALVAAPLAAYGLFVLDRRCAGALILGGVAAGALLLGYHSYVFGGPLRFPYHYSIWPTPHTGWFMGIGRPNGEALTGILTGEYRGLFHTAPWLAFALPGALLLARRYLLETLLCVWAVLALLWLNASIPPWDGGWASGPRYLVPMLPFASLLAGGVLPWLLPRPGQPSAQLSVRLAGVVLFGWLTLHSVAQQFAVTAVKPELPTHLRRPYAELVWPSFRRGELAISTQSIEMRDNPTGAPRQAWNLGMKLGLSGHPSLVPLYAWVAATLAGLIRALSARSPS